MRRLPRSRENPQRSEAAVSNQHSATPAKFGVRGIPTLIIFKNGVVAQTKVGGLSKAQITALVDSHV
ncbi:thioredoxin domain-containing protein [Streptomyces sp. NPDC002734]|uniref:thioredoxin family protein n=1 Tax=Streptomyces sp. NPDC002734 TaxID=3154426 RepID=UPI0033223F07